MNDWLKISIPNIGESKSFVTSIMLNATASGLIMAFSMLYFVKTTTLSLSIIGLSITLGRGLASAVPIIVGQLLDQIGPRKISVLGDFISGVGFILCMFARDSITVVLTQLFIQAGSHMFWMSSRGLVNLASNGKELHTWFGMVGSLRNIGLGLGTLICSLAFSVAANQNLHVLILFSAFLYFSSCIVLYFWRPMGENENQKIYSGRRSVRLKQVWLDEKYKGLLYLNLGVVITAMVIPFVIVFYVTEQLALPAFVSGGLILLNTMMVAFFSVHLASWTKRNASLNNIKWGYVLNIVSFVLFWVAGFLKSHLFMVSLVLIFAMIVYSIAEMLTSPATNVLSLELAPKHNNGHHMAAFQMTWSVGMTLSPFVFGWLMDFNRYSTWPALIVFLTVIYIYGSRKINDYECDPAELNGANE